MNKIDNFILWQFENKKMNYKLQNGNNITISGCLNKSFFWLPTIQTQRHRAYTTEYRFMALIWLNFALAVCISRNAPTIFGASLKIKTFNGK